MTTELPPGVLIKSNQAKERCGKCNQAFTIEIYLDPLTERRYQRILCKNCRYDIPTGDY